MRKYGVDFETARDKVFGLMGWAPAMYDGTPRFTQAAKEAIMHASDTATHVSMIDPMGRKEVLVSADDLLRSLLEVRDNWNIPEIIMRDLPRGAF